MSDSNLSTAAFYDELCQRLGDDLDVQVLPEDVLTREQLQRVVFNHFATEPATTKLSCGDMLLRGAVELANAAQKRFARNDIDCDTAFRAVDKCCRALETAHVYCSYHPASVQLEAAKRAKAALLCSRGVEQINRAQEKLKAEMDRLTKSDSRRAESPRRIRRSVENALDTAIAAVREGISNIEKAVQLDSADSHAQKQLEVGKDLPGSLEEQRPIRVSSHPAADGDIPVRRIGDEDTYYCPRDSQALECLNVALDLGCGRIYAYYCRKEHVHWVHDCHGINPPLRWYGPFDGFPDETDGYDLL